MDRRSTKDHVEREQEEIERLVRPAPKVKPPRHDKRRERVETDDPDLDTEDKDLSRNYKTIGGSLGAKVFHRWGRGSETNSKKKVKVRNKETDWVGWISEDSLKGSPGEYEAVKDDAPEKFPKKTQAPKPPEAPKAPESDSQPTEPKAVPQDDLASKRELLSLGAKNPQVKWTLDHVGDPNGVLGHFADKYPVENLLQGQKLPAGVKTVGDLRRVLRSEEPATQEQAPAEAPAKKPVKKKQPKNTNVVERFEDLQKEQENALSRIKEVKEELKEDPKSEGAKAELAAQKEVIKSIKEVADIRKQLEEAKAQLDAFDKGESPKPKMKAPKKGKPPAAGPASGPPVLTSPAVPEVGPAAAPPAAQPPPGQPPAPAQAAPAPAAPGKDQKNPAPKGKLPPAPPPAGAGATPPQVPGAPPAPPTPADPQAPAPTEPAAVPGPQRRPVSKAEASDSINLILSSFPESMAAKLLVINPPLHPDDVQSLVSDYHVAKSLSIPTDKLDELRAKASKFYSTNPDTVPPPKTVKAKDGKPVPFESLSSEEQHVELRKHQIRTVAMSLAAKDAISTSLQKKAKAPPPLADAMSDFMLTNSGESPEERKVRSAKRAEALFFSTIGAVQEETDPASAASGPKPVVLPEQPNEKGKSKKPKLKPKETNRFDQDPDARPKKAESPPVSDSTIKQILKSSKDPAVRRLAVSYFQAQDYKLARKKFLDSGSPDVVSERQPPDVIASRLNKAADFLRDRSKLYPENLLAQDTAQTFRARVMKQLATLSPQKATQVQGQLDDYDNRQYEKDMKRYPKALKEYFTHEKQAEKETANDYAEYSEKVKKGWEGDPPLSTEERLEAMGLAEPNEPRKPARYDMQRQKPEDLAQEAQGMWDEFTSRSARSTRVAVRAQPHLFSTYPHPFAMGRTAVYWGQAPYEGSKSYEGWQQPHARDLDKGDFERVLKGARTWLKSPMLSKNVEGVVRDTQLRAALDLALREENFDAALHPVLYNHLLARLAGVPEDETLLTVTASKTRNPMSNKVELETAQADKFLESLDRIASVVQENHEKWGLKFEAAKALVNQIDKLADEIESATYGDDSMLRRQARVMGVKVGEVIQRDSDEKYMDAFKNPMSPLQTEADEPYMKAYKDDQSSAVHSGKSTTGKPLAKS